MKAPIKVLLFFQKEFMKKNKLILQNLQNEWVRIRMDIENSHILLT